jgi:hypothetical protein
MFQRAVTGAALKDINIENASVRLIDQTAEQQTETVYKNIALHSEVAPAETSGVSHATGELRADSNETNGGEILKTTLPFDLKISRNEAGGLVVEGMVGPGPFETANLVARSFTLTTKLNTERGQSSQPGGPQQQASGIRGEGHISASEMVLPRINVSEQVARAVQINGIGDMNAGTTINTLETDFQIDQGVYRTTGLRIAQLDGLGDASADQGWFKIASALTLNYAAKITLSDEATAQVKSANPAVGDIVTLLQNSPRLSVSFNITGDVRNPEVRVDLLRTLGL